MIVTPPAPEPIPFETLLSRSWALLRRNWIIVLPPIIAVVLVTAGVIALMAGFVAQALAHGGHARGASPPPGGGFAGIFAFAALAIVLSLWANAAMFGMADAAWAKGTATFADGNAAFRTRAGALIVAYVGLIGLAIVAAILILPTLGLAILALPLFTMYVIPSVVTGGRDGFTAIAESFRLVVRFFGASALALLILLGIQWGISMLATAPLYPLQLSIISSIGPAGVPRLPPAPLLVAGGVWFVIAMAIGQAYTGYYAIAIVGLYRSLFGRPGTEEPPAPVVPV